MKIYFTYNAWKGGFISSIQKAFDLAGCETSMCPDFKPPFMNRLLRKLPLKEYRKELNRQKVKLRDLHFLEQIKRYNPDYLFMQNCGGLLPETLKTVQQDYGIKTISYIVDAPCSNNRSNWAVSMRYNDIIINPEDSWNRILFNLAPDSKIVKFYGGYDPDKFFPPEIDNLTEKDKELLAHDIVFTGGSYGENPEGAYRAGILGQLAEDGYNVTIYGDDGWKHWFRFYPYLANSYNGGRLNYEELRKMLRLSKMYINMPSPQIATSFQPRIFELAACKCFQILDYSKDYSDIFDEDRIATFKNYNDLKEKIEFYSKNPEERQKVVDYMYLVVNGVYSFNNQIKQLAEELGIC